MHVGVTLFICKAIVSMSTGLLIACSLSRVVIRYVLEILLICFFRFVASLRSLGFTLRRRGWGAITIDILESTLTPQKKMRIMYRANLNYARFNKYFSDFLKKGFIEAIEDLDGKACYRISQRGETLLVVLKKAQELASSDEL